MDEKFVKAKQYKNFGYIAGALAVTFIVMMTFRSSSSNLHSRHYTKKLNTGADGLSDKELWVEKSTNEIEEIRNSNKRLEDQNKLLQKRLDSIQKMVIGLGVHLNAFDDQQEDKTNTIPSKDVPEYQAYKKQNPYISAPTDAAEMPQSGQSEGVSLQQLENFSEQRGVLNASKIEKDNGKRLAGEKIQKSGIKVIQFQNADNEYDLSENFIFAGTYARAVLTGSVVASAGIGASSNPEPVLLRITDGGNLPNHVKGFLKDAVVIGAAYGDLSSESVVIRLERIVKIDNKSGVGVDIPVKGYVAGENGCSKIRGMVFDRASKVARNSAVAGFLSGMAEYISINNNSAFKFEPNSGLAQFSPQAGSKMLQQGASKGIGNAVEKYADFIIKRAEQMQPVIMLDGGRRLTIVFTESVKASSVHLKKVRKELYSKKRI
ncbi:MAG: TraB/VirB10 family protein [Alphaproteobacteria bacterium]|nr:TraB/VirB10 family protein [Alphaproteobacteria bacterium]